MSDKSVIQKVVESAAQVHAERVAKDRRIAKLEKQVEELRSELTVSRAKIAFYRRRLQLIAGERDRLKRGEADLLADIDRMQAHGIQQQAMVVRLSEERGRLRGLLRVADRFIRHRGPCDWSTSSECHCMFVQLQHNIRCEFDPEPHMDADELRELGGEGR